MNGPPDTHTIHLFLSALPFIALSQIAHALKATNARKCFNAFPSGDITGIGKHNRNSFVECDSLGSQGRETVPSLSSNNMQQIITPIEATFSEVSDPSAKCAGHVMSMLQC